MAFTFLFRYYYLTKSKKISHEWQEIISRMARNHLTNGKKISHERQEIISRKTK
ncbi:MAG: hypothetical protein UHS55_07615 [Prevotella sp.]|nr:hypothetical protein [Prevotella sp.]